MQSTSATIETLELLAKSDDKAVVHFRMDNGATKSIDGEGKPIPADLALIAVKVAYDAAQSVGSDIIFSVSRFDG